MGEHVVQLALDCACDLGESPVWDARTGTLYFVDINKMKVYAFKPAVHDPASRVVTIETPEKVGTIVPTSDPNRIVACLHQSIVTIDVAERRMADVLASTPMEHGVEGWRFNDGKASPQGALIVGRMHSDWRKGVRGRTYRLDWEPPGGGGIVGHRGVLVEVMKPEDVVLPNGMAWDEAKGIFYFVDTGTNTIWRYKADEHGGPLRNSEGFLELAPPTPRLTVPKEGGVVVPDGLTVDADGNLWVALAEGGAVACLHPDSGKELRRVALPVKRPTACTFGGPELDILYVTTRQEPGTDASPHAGGLFAARIPRVRGAAGAYPVQLPEGV